MWYLIETISFVIIIAILLIVYKIKKFNGLKEYLILATSLIVIVFSVTFMLEKPVLNITENISYEVKTHENLDKVQAYYHFADVSNKIQIRGEVDFNKVGSYQVEYTIPTMFGDYTKEQTIEIVDTTSPVITLEGNEIEKIGYKKEYQDAGYTVTDNSDEDLQDKVTVNKEEVSNQEYKLIYTVEDSSHNIATVTRTIELIDDEAPEIKLKGNSKITLEVNAKYQEEGATATDEIDGDLTDKIEISGKVDTAKAGKYTVTYKVTDNSGNEAKKTRTITVSNGNDQVVVQDNSNPGTNTGNNSGIIYLTFDDGPSSTITPKVLDVLKEKGVKATFFILNYSAANEKLVKREINEGHTIGIHGYSHTYSEIYTSVDAYMNNITKLRDKLKSSTGYDTIYTRFPGGSSNTVSRRYCKGIMTQLTKEVVARGYKYFDWNVSSGDAGNAKTSQDVYNNVTKGLKPNRTNIVLMHDFSGNTKTLNALASIIDYGLKNGYKFSSINSSTPMIKHSVNN